MDVCTIYKRYENVMKESSIFDKGTNTSDAFGIGQCWHFGAFVNLALLTPLDTFDNFDMVFWVDTIETVDSVFTVRTANNIQIVKMLTLC